MKKLLYVCASLLCLALGAAVLVLSAAAGLRLLREPPAAQEGAAVNAAAPVPAAVPAPVASAGDTAEKSAPAEKDVPVVKPGTLVYTVDFEKVLKNSVPGRAVTGYAQKYEAVMTQNISKLNAALADKKKKYNVPAVKKAIAQFTKQKTDVWVDARKILLGLVHTAVAPSPLKDALLLDKSEVLNLPEGLDKTDELISLIDRLKLKLPDPPKPIEIK